MKKKKYNNLKKFGVWNFIVIENGVGGGYGSHLSNIKFYKNIFSIF